MDKNSNWWQKSVFYQIYPRSYCDSSNTGVGEINVKIQIADKNSMLSFYKRLLQLRKDYHCLLGDTSNIFREEKNAFTTLET